MEIREDVYRAHQRLSGCSAKFLDFVKNNPESLRRSNFSELEINYGKIKLQSWPTFIDKRTKEEIKEASVGVCQLIKSLPQRMFSNNPSQVSRYYEISDHMAATLLDGISEEHIDNLIARGDFIFSSSGLKCLEYNISANVGGWEIAMWEPLYLKIPIISRFLQQYGYNGKIRNDNLLSILFKHFIHTALDKFPGGCDTINIAAAFLAKGIDNPTQLYINQLYKNILRQISIKLKGRIAFCRYQDLDIVDDVVYYKGEQVHVLVEMYEGVVPPEFVKAVKSNNVIIYNGHITGLMSNKLNLVLLAENANSDIFTPEERELITRYIPWTRKMVPCKTTFDGRTIDLEDFVCSNREQLVIKPSIGSGGESVYVGHNLYQSHWIRIAQNAFRTRGWVVQEYVESLPYLYQVGESRSAPHNAVWGFFVFGSRYAGAWVRVLPREGNPGVVNSRQGAEESVILEIDE
ncbi:MAG: hypothetical protein JSV88_27325 [Candidatus Aminicenantes bacterium]|nr:MAG: hypothetical protein JSV88_27325 [Candidatus Aminicenantes bacterium]